MKTTIELLDDLYRRAKAIAVLKGQTMKEWLTNLLRREVSASALAKTQDDGQQDADAFIEELNRLAADISAHWQGPQDAVAAIREQRRDIGA